MGNSEKKTRKLWIDMLRGIAMLLVIWGHIAKSERAFFLITSPFKLPLFFAITGYVFNDKNGDIVQFLKNLLFRIIVPWFVLSLVWLRIIYAFIIGEPERIGALLYNFISGQAFWFMPCCVVAECILFFIKKFIKEVKLQYLMLGGVCVIGLVLAKFEIARFGMIDVACVSQGFILFGVWFRNSEIKIREKIGVRATCFLMGLYIALILVSAIIYPGRAIDVHNNRYYNLLLCGLLIASSLLILFIVAPKLRKVPKWLVFVGQNTLVFYIGHPTARILLNRILGIMHLALPLNIVGYSLTMIYVCVTMSISAIVLNRWFPFFVGKKRNDKFYKKVETNEY